MQLFIFHTNKCKNLLMRNKNEETSQTALEGEEFIYFYLLISIIVSLYLDKYIIDIYKAFCETMNFI